MGSAFRAAAGEEERAYISVQYFVADGTDGLNAICFSFPKPSWNQKNWKRRKEYENRFQAARVRLEDYFRKQKPGERRNDSEDHIRKHDPASAIDVVADLLFGEHGSAYGREQRYLVAGFSEESSR